MKFIYKWTGLQYIVDSIVLAVFNYKLSLRMVPVSYKLFVWSLGVMVGSSVVFVTYETPKMFESHTITIEREVKHAEASSVEVIEWKQAEFSAYTASSDETDGSPLIMASGKMVYIGAVACPRDIALGSRIEVRGLGSFTCEDRMNIRYTNHFDIFMVTKSEALKFGRKNMEYRIIK